jgi:hypothetical protein
MIPFMARKYFSSVPELQSHAVVATPLPQPIFGSTMEANAALRTIVRRDSGETYREMLTRMAEPLPSQRLSMLARRRGGPEGGLRQPQPVAIGRR